MHLPKLKSPLLPLTLALVFLLTGVSTHGADDFTRMKFAPLPPFAVAAGDTVSVAIGATIQDGWYIYSMKETIGPDGVGPQATTVELVGTPLKIVRSSMANIKKVYDSSFQVTVEKVFNRALFRVLLRAPADLKAGSYPVKFSLWIQRCDSSSCLPPKEFIVTSTVNVGEAIAGTVPIEDSVGSGAVVTPNTLSTDAQTGDAKSSVDSDIDDARKEGLISFFLLGMLVGLGALATPCVYPMVPITVSFFTKRSEKNKAGQLTDAAVFAGGIVLTFTLIGIIVSAIWGASQVGSFAADPWTNLIIGLLFVVLAFNLFGAFEIQVPVSILNTLNKKSQGTGYSATFLMGVTFAVISFTCTGAFVAGALGSANQGDYLYPTVGMLGFAISFAAPFFILALAPSLMTRMPRSGGWMNNVKVVLGFLEIAFALKFLSSADLNFSWGILPRDLVLAIWIGIGFLIVLYLLGTYRMTLDSPLESVSGLRAAFAIVFASISFWLFTGLGNRPLGEIDGILPPLNYEEIIAIGRGDVAIAAAGPTAAGIGGARTPAIKSEEYWFDNLDNAKVEAKKTGKPIFVDFTGFTCTNCRWMEQNMFTRPSVASRMSRYILVRLFTDRRTEPFISNQRLQERDYGSLTLPLYVVLTSDGAYVAKADYTRDEKKFAAFLDKALPLNN